MDLRTRRLMIMHNALHPRDDVDRLYVSRKEGSRELASIEGAHGVVVIVAEYGHGDRSSNPGRD